MKALLLSLLLLIISQTAEAQVAGKIQDEKGQPIPFVTATLLNSADSTILLASQSDEQGAFALKYSKPGTYKLRLSAIGFQIYTSPSFDLTAAQPAKDFSELVLEANSKQLTEILVRASKPLTQQRSDGTVVNVESSMLSKGSSALEVLERSPGVVIDRQNGGLSLNGRNGVQVMINGKLLRMPVEQVMAILNGMNAGEVSRVKLLTNPSAAYDAEGSGGLINIVLKDNRRKGTRQTIRSPEATVIAKKPRPAPGWIITRINSICTVLIIITATILTVIFMPLGQSRNRFWAAWHNLIIKA